MKPKIIIDNRIPYITSLLDNVADILYLPYADITHDSLRNADAIVIRTRTKCDRQLLEGTRIRLIVTATIGMDHIDTKYCESAGITIRNAPGCNASSVAQWVGEALRVWQGTNASTHCKIGIVGLGHVGSRVRSLAESLGYEVMVCDPPLGYTHTLADLARHCRIITFHTPLTTTGDHPTKGMAGHGFFASLMPDAYIINAARGGIVDEYELKLWLKTHPEGRCAIDCWQNEPAIDRELLAMTLIGTPHIAGYSADGKWNGTCMSIRSLNDFFGFNAPLPPALPPAPDTSRYDILADSTALKHSPDRFEHLRSHYPIRRE